MRHLFVILGGTGDLAGGKLMPALYRLLVYRGLRSQSVLLGVATRPWTDDVYRDWTREQLARSGLTDEAVKRWCDESVHYQQIGPDPDSYRVLGSRIAALEASHDLPGNRVLYLALPPSVVPGALEGLSHAGLSASAGWTRVVVEKPFGSDVHTAQQLNELIHRSFSEDQVYRIDHYLGKATVQNLLVFRFANPLFEMAWNRDRIESVHITVAESIGIGERGGYYDSAGVVRDMVQSHLTQLLSLVAMEPPTRFDADAIRSEKVKVLQAVRDVMPGDAVLGQYGPGSIDGVEVSGYRQEPKVSENSDTPTGAALRLSIDNWRWQGVPFYLRTGKRLPGRLTQVAVTFRRPPVCLFEDAHRGCQVHPNVLLVTLQPDEGFELLFDVKAPEEPLRLETLPLRFSYADAFGEMPLAYETLLEDIISGDQTLFVRADEVEAAWKLYEPLLDPEIPVHVYEAGTWGPRQFDVVAPRPPRLP